MRIGVVGALRSELAILEKSIVDPTRVPLAETMMTKGMLGAHEILLAHVSIGPINAAAKTQALISEYKPDLIINTGIAGALDPSVRVLHIVVSDQTVIHDVDAALFSSFYPFATAFEADAVALEHAITAAKELGFDAHAGRIATGNAFVADDATKRDIHKRTDALCVEMEGGAVAQVCAMNKVPFLILRTISDDADDDAPETYDQFEIQAADRSAHLVTELIGRLPERRQA